MKPTAPIASLEPGDILSTVFASSEAENAVVEQFNAELKPRAFTADLSAFAGQTVRLRIAVAANQSPLTALLDDVSVTSALLPPNPIEPAPTPPPSNVIADGPLRLRKKSGLGFLSVNVPGPGVLIATDARRAIAVATSRRRKGRARPVLIKTATLESGAAGTLDVPIRPTPAGLKILKKKGKLSFKVRLTFAPTGGNAATQSYSGRLVKKVRPAPR
jgi:hypothetical protein